MKNNLPYNVLRNPNDWSNVPRVEVVAAYFFPTAIAAGGTAAFLATAATYLAVSAVTSWAIAALAPKPDFSSFGSQGTLVNARDATAPADFVYGEVRKGGTITYYESTGDKNKFLHQIIVLAGHEVAEIGDIYINEEVVTLDSNGYVTDAEWVIDGGANPSGIRIQKFLGDQTTAPADLLSESELTGGNALDANFVGRGIAYLYVRYEFDQTVFANGVPLITAKVKGKKVYDPRTSTTGYSNNAALCIRDFITSEYGLNDSAVDDVVFSAAANESDESVTLSGSGTEKRYTINGIIKASSPTGKVLGEMATACAGTLFWGSGYWKLKVGAYSAPVKTLTLDDLRGPINLNTRSSMRDSFNGVTGTFNDASADFITADYPPIKSSTFQTEDGGDELLLDLPLPFTTSAATAQRIAKMTLYRGREQMTISADFGLEAFNVEVGDIIAFTNERYGFDEKEFEVIGWRFESNQEAGDLRVNLTLQETSQAAFAWNAEESDIIGNNTNLPVANAGLVVNNLTASDSTRLQGDGTTVNSAILAWTAVSSSFFAYYDVEWKQTSDSTYASTTTTESGIEISPLIDGVEYTFRVRAVSVTGATGSYATVTLTSGGDTTAPSAPTSVSADGGFRYITVSWTNPADVDLNYVEVYENDTNNSGSATLVGTSAGSEFIRPNLGISVTKYYFLKAVDYSGNKSAFTAGVSGTTTFIDDPDFENGVYSLFTEQNLYAIRDVTSLPASGTFVGEKVFNRTDGKLYQWTGSAWEQVVGGAESFADLQGSIAQSQIPNGIIDTAQIADDAIVAGKISANAVGANAIAADSIYGAAIQGGVITGDKITANTITGGLLATSGIITTSAQITDAVVSNAKIENLAVTTIKIADQAVSNTGVDNQTSYVSMINTITWADIASVTLSADGGQVILNTRGKLTFGGIGEGDSYGFEWRFLIGSTVISGESTGAGDPFRDSFFSDIKVGTAPTGSVTIKLQGRKDGIGNNSVQAKAILIATELKK